MKDKTTQLAASIFRRAMELEGLTSYELQLDGDNTVDFVDAVVGEKGGLSSLMLASDRIAVTQYGARLWDCGYAKSDTSGDGLQVKPVEEFSDAEAASSYRAIESIDARSEVGLALLIAREAVKQLCEPVNESVARLKGVPGYFFGADFENDQREEVAFEAPSEIIAFGFRQMMVANRELVLSLGQDLSLDAQPERTPTGP